MYVRFRIAPIKEVRVQTVVIGLILLLWASLPAAGTPPSPIAASDLELFARRLDLSGEQRQVMDEYYMAYLERYWQTGVASAPQDSRSARLEKLPDEIPDLAAIRAALKDRRRALTSMQRLDESFFTALQEILTEPQQQQMTRVRSLRERTLLMRDELVSEWYEQGQHLDLGLIVDNLDMTVEQRETARPSLEAYERNLTQLLRRLWEASGDMRRDWRRRLDRQAIEPKEAWIEVAREVHPVGLEAVAHNRLWIERIAAVLPERAAVVIRYQFDSSPFYRFLMYASIPARLHFAQSLDDLTDDQRENLRSLYHQAARERVRLLKPINDMFRTVRDAAVSMNERIEAIIDKEQITAARKMVREHTRSSARTELSFAKREASRKRSTTWTRGVAPPETFLPAPLTDTEFELYADLLQLSPEQRELLRDAVAAQQDGFRTIRADITEPLIDLYIGSKARPVPDKPGFLGLRFSPPEDVQQGIALIEAYLKQADTLERRLHDEMLAIVPDDRRDAAEALWQSRTIAMRPTPKEYRNEVGLNDFMLALRCDAARVDPLALMHDLDLSVAERKAILDVIAEEAAGLHDAARTYFKANLDGWKSFCDLYSVVIASEYKNQEAFAALREAHPKHDDLVRRARHETMKIVLRLAYGIGDALAPGHADTYLARFERAAFPIVTYDPTGVAGRFDAALKREDLTDGQRAALAQHRADYDSHYQRLSRQLIDLDLEWEDAYARGEAGEAARNRLEQAIDQLRFEREALNYVYGKKLENALGRKGED